MVLIEAVIFVLSSGLIFNERFRTNKSLMAIAGLIALASSYLILEEVTKRIVKDQLGSQSPAPAIIAEPSPKKPATPVGPNSVTNVPQDRVCVTFNGRLVCE